MMQRLFKKPANKPLRSYAQCGEDILAHNILCRQLRIQQPTYLDIGANDPVRFSNTYLLYKLGCTGLLVEPDPDLAIKLRRKRPRDTVLEAGIATSDPAQGSHATLYRMNQPTLNTFSLEEAESACAQGPYNITEQIRVPMVGIEQAITQHQSERPHFVSIDAEGMDLAILNSYDLKAHRPVLICIETIDFCETNIGRPRTEVYDQMHKLGYFLHSRSHINGLFVCTQAWAERFGAPPPAIPQAIAA